MGGEPLRPEERSEWAAKPRTAERSLNGPENQAEGGAEAIALHSRSPPVWAECQSEPSHAIRRGARAAAG